MRTFLQSTSRVVMLKLFLTSDHVSAATGKTVAIKISKNGGAFADPNAGATNATEVSSGWYKVTLDATDTATVGDLVVRGTSASCDDSEQVGQVIVDPATNATAVSAIKTQTDKMAFTVTNQIDANVLDWKSATAPAMTGDAFARLGAPAGASVSADVAAIKSDTGTTLTDVNSGAGAIYTRLGAPAGASIAADIAAAKVDTAAVKVVTDQLVAAQAEPTGAPTVNPTPLVKIARIYQALRNKVTVTASAKTFFDDSAGALWSKALSDDGTTYTEAKGS